MNSGWVSEPSGPIVNWTWLRIPFIYLFIYLFTYLLTYLLTYLFGWLVGCLFLFPYTFIQGVGPLFPYTDYSFHSGYSRKESITLNEGVLLN